MADRIIKGDSGNDVVIQNNDASRKIEVTNSGDVEVTGDVKTTTVKATNLKANDGTAALVVSDSTGEVTSSAGLKAVDIKATNIKANDGTSSISIADTTGNITLNNPISSGTFNGLIGPSATFSTGQIVKVTPLTYAPNAIQNLYSGTSTTTLFYNSNLDQTVSLTSGNKLAVFINGGRLTIGTAGSDGFQMNIQVNSVNYIVGGIFANDVPLNVFCVSDAISATSTTIKFGGLSRFDNRTPTLDLRNAAVSGSPLRYLIYEIQV